MLPADIVDIVAEVIKMPFTYLFSPNKRVFILYLFTSFLLALYVYYRSKEKTSFADYFFSRKRWMGNSAKIDYLLIFFNSLIKVLIIAPVIVYVLYVAEGINKYLIESFGVSNLNWSISTIVLLYTVCIVVVNDFLSFFIHYLMHKIPVLWEFHKIHHAATELNPFTQYRIHPIELIINNLGTLMVKALITGVFLYLGNGSVHLITFLGINVLNFLFFFFGANLRHSHVKLTYFDFLENILISPFQHQIHHSNKKEHFDTNLGSRLAIWDYLFGTLIKSKDVKEITFGLGEEDDSYRSLTQNLFSPFKNLYFRLKK
ncbi:MAG: sterol desaturase family protein [Vicingus serpentipes]|nr:sterol desaturase family protein [Vicingus serpentipes]